MTDASRATSFAEDWVAAWNAHDLDRILSYYAAGIVLLSPIAQKRLGNDHVEGMVTLREYWSGALSAQPDLKFELIETMTGCSSLTVYRMLPVVWSRSMNSQAAA